MITRYTYKDLVWLDVESPSQEEVRQIMQEFDIDPLIAEELLVPTLKSKVDLYKDFIYLILHFPAIKHTYSGTPNQEIDFIIGKKFIITARYDTIDPMHKFSKVFEVNSIIDKSDMGEHAGMIFFYMIRKLYRALLHELDYIRTELENTEDKMFKQKELQVVRDLSEISRMLLNFENMTSAHADILSSFDEAGKKLFGNEFSYHLRAISSEYYKVKHAIDNQREFLRELRETNNSLLSTKQNEVMKGLTILALTTLPITIVASIFNTNAVYVPFVGRPNDFWIIVGLGLIASLALALYFKRKKWF